MFRKPTSIFVNLLVPSINVYRSVYYYILKVRLKKLCTVEFFPKLPPLMYRRVPNSQNKPSSPSVRYEMSQQHPKTLINLGPLSKILAELDSWTLWKRGWNVSWLNCYWGWNAGVSLYSWVKTTVSTVAFWLAEKFYVRFSERKIMESVFWDW